MSAQLSQQSMQHEALPNEIKKVEEERREISRNTFRMRTEHEQRVEKLLGEVNKKLKLCRKWTAIFSRKQ